jgi:TusA-related sulfurtransferase
VKTAKAMRELRPGRLIEVFTNDPGSAPDIIAWSKTTGNPIVEARALDGVYRFVLKKKSRITAAGTAARRPRRPPVVHSEVTTP